MHNLCVFLLFFSKITFYWILFSDCCDQFGYPKSIVYLSCFILFIHDLHLCNNFGASNINIEDFKGKNSEKTPPSRLKIAIKREQIISSIFCYLYLFKKNFCIHSRNIIVVAWFSNPSNNSKFDFEYIACL